MKVLSLFDGISCGMIALERAGIDVERYVAYEIDEFAIKVSKHNYPNIEHRGNVIDADFAEFSDFDLVIGGSPCTFWSVANGKKECSLEGEGGKLFKQFLRAIKEIKPKWFIYENNSGIPQNIQKDISKYLKVDGCMINSNLVSAQNRKRIYWTNIPILPIKDENIYIKDIIDINNTNNIIDRMKAKIIGTLAHKKTWGNVKGLNEKSNTVTTRQGICNSGATNIKHSENFYTIPSVIECCRLQTLPDNYFYHKGKLIISKTQAIKCIGNGWTADIIAGILKGLKGDL